jgi:hypothetical protein
VPQFIQRHQQGILGVLEGFDRILFRGTLRSISYSTGLDKFLGAQRVLLKDFKAFAQGCTDRLAAHAQALAEAAGRPYHYLPSAALRKEQIAADIARRDGLTQGLVCVLACVEPCRSFELRRDRQRRRLELRVAPRKCRFFYFYYLDADFGLMHVRVASWLPFEVQVCLNGREYLARQLDREGIGYEKADNCFLAVDDLPRAQALLDKLQRLHWAPRLRRWVAPLLRPLLGRGGPLAHVHGYYWTIRQSEYASDVMFRDAATLGELYPRLCRHAMEALHSPEVLRFLGQKSAGRREISTDLRRRIEGVRVKHRVGDNSIKMYDKQGSVLRVETTINDPHMFRCLRRAQDDPASPLQWRKLRKAVADTARRVRVSRDANQRYLAALAVVDQPTAIHRVLDPISRPVRKAGDRSRGLRPVDPQEAALFAAVLRGEHLLRGFRNADIQAHWFRRAARDELERQRRSAQVGHRLRLLRRHGLIHKVGRQRLYRITPKGHQVMSLALALREANAAHLKAA